MELIKAIEIASTAKYQNPAVRALPLPPRSTHSALSEEPSDTHALTHTHTGYMSHSQLPNNSWEDIDRAHPSQSTNASRYRTDTWLTLTDGIHDTSPRCIAAADGQELMKILTSHDAPDPAKLHLRLVRISVATVAVGER